MHFFVSIYYYIDILFAWVSWLFDVIYSATIECLAIINRYLMGLQLTIAGLLLTYFHWVSDIVKIKSYLRLFPPSISFEYTRNFLSYSWNKVWYLLIILWWFLSELDFIYSGDFLSVWRRNKKIKLKKMIILKTFRRIRNTMRSAMNEKRCNLRNSFLLLFCCSWWFQW